MRVDQLLVQRGLARSRSQAARLVEGGVAWRLGAAAPWRTAAKAGEEVPESAELALLSPAEGRYVSRGGLKLEGALRASGMTVAGHVCLDVGQSTGGFTDCLLAHGAAAVLGVDVGHGQLHPRLQADPRVLSLEHINARHLSPAQLREPLNALLLRAEISAPESAKPILEPAFERLVADLSFISLTRVLPALRSLLAEGGQMLLLVKPQFELQPQDIGKGGLVRDPALYAQVQQRLLKACAECGLAVRAWLESPVAGGDGNREFFLHAQAA